MQTFRYKPNNDWDASYGFHYATSSDIPCYDRLIQRENGDIGQLVPNDITGPTDLDDEYSGY